MSDLQSTTAQPPLFSIIIPAYNYAHTLPRSVESVIGQLSDDVELIIINDGSKDNTAEVITTLETKYPSAFRAIHQNNSGLAATRNRGIQESSGEFLIFLDADDELAEGAILNLRQAIQCSPNIDMLIGAHISVEPDGRERFRPRNPLPESREECFKLYLIDGKLPISNGATAMRRKIFDGYMYPVHFRCVEDISMFAYVLANFECMTLNKAIAKIHKHADSMRNDVSTDLSIGMELVNEVFAFERLSEKLIIMYRKPYEVRRLLSIFRSLYVAKKYRQSLTYYVKAVKTSPTALLYGSYLRKAARALLLSVKS